MKQSNLGKEELSLKESIERGEWKSSPESREEIGKLTAYAKESLKKDKRVNIRISTADLEALQAIAIEDGIPCQTLMSSILHRYASGRFVDSKRR